MGKTCRQQAVPATLLVARAPFEEISARFREQRFSQVRTLLQLLEEACRVLPDRFFVRLLGRGLRCRRRGLLPRWREMCCDDDRQNQDNRSTAYENQIL